MMMMIRMMIIPFFFMKLGKGFLPLFSDYFGNPVYLETNFGNVLDNILAKETRLTDIPSFT